MMKAFLCLTAFVFSFVLLAQDVPPTSEPTPAPLPSDDLTVFNSSRLIARASLNDGYALPAASILGIADIKINNRGDVAFDVDVLGGLDLSAIWFTPHMGEGSAVYRSSIADRLLTDPGLNNKGDLVFSQFDFGINDGVFKYDAIARSVTLVLRPGTDTALSFPAINDVGTILTRATNDAGDRSFRLLRGTTVTELAREGVVGPQGKTASYLFTPVLNNQGFVAAKVRLGERGQVDESQPDEIRLWRPDGTYEIVAQDINAQPASLFLRFGNSVSLSDSKHVAFVATISGDRQGVFLFGEGKVKAIAIEGQGELEAIEAFSPMVNSKGLVVFRGRLKSGKSAIFKADWNAFKVVVKQGDLVPSDLETAKIYDREDNQGFIGTPSINDSGVIAFHAGILSKDGERFLGQAIYVLSTATPADQR